MADDSFYMKQALAEAARAAERGEVPVGAVVVCRDRILARAHNLTETLHDVTAHAEMQALTAAANSLGAKYLTDCTLYVKRGYQRYAPQALHPKTVVVKGVLADECAGLMKDFFRKRR